VLPSAHQSEQPKQQIDWFSHFCTVHSTVSSGTLVPPGKYDWTCSSFGPMESTTQTANRSLQPFLPSSRQKVPIPYNGHTFPQKLPLPMGIWIPCNTWFLPKSESTTQTPSRSVQPFFHKQLNAECSYTLESDTPFPRKIAPSQGIPGPHIIHGYLDPTEFSTQTASRSVQPFLQGSLVWQTKRPHYLDGNNRLHLCMTYVVWAMQPSNKSR